MSEPHRSSARLPRLHVTPSLGPNAQVELDKSQANYLLNVLRLGEGGEVLIFNGRDGEWRAHMRLTGKKSAALVCTEQTRPQTFPPDVHLLFAPLKSARLDYMAQKATEMGASRLIPVITQRTQVSRINVDRLLANAVEAAEQCELVSVPEVALEEKLPAALAHLERDRVLIFCDEDAPLADPLVALSSLRPDTPVVVLIGPEGGFSDEERRMLLAHEPLVRLSLGPRVLRADTAAVAALALVQASIDEARAS